MTSKSAILNGCLLAKYAIADIFGASKQDQRRSRFPILSFGSLCTKKKGIIIGIGIDLVKHDFLQMTSNLCMLYIKSKSVENQIIWYQPWARVTCRSKNFILTSKWVPINIDGIGLLYVKLKIVMYGFFWYHFQVRAMHNDGEILYHNCMPHIFSFLAIFLACHCQFRGWFCLPRPKEARYTNHVSAKGRTLAKSSAKANFTHAPRFSLVSSFGGLLT